jgi:hypothetical protein
MALTRAAMRRMVRGRRFVGIEAATRLVAIGDSHCKFWSGSDALWGPDRIAGVVTCHVGPGLAWNLVERSSRTRAGRNVRHILRDLGTQAYGGWVLLCFGEIDLRVHVLKHAAESGLRPGVARLVERYLAFVLEAQRIHPRIALWAPGASQPAGIPDNPAYPATGSETERNDATALFADLLDERAREIGAPVLSLLPLLLDEHGMTRRELLFDGNHISQALLPQALRQAAEKLDIRLDAPPPESLAARTAAA